MDTLLFLGTGDAMGVPRVYCDCPVCQEARTEGANQRMRSLVQVKGEVPFLIDCGPDWRRQMELTSERMTKHIVVTHAHFDHIGGLPEWADACRWTGERGKLYAPAEVLTAISKQFPWLMNHLELIAIDDGFKLSGWRIVTWKVCHGKNGYSYAYRLEKDGFAWVYCSDSINLSEEEKRNLYDLDLLVLGTSFYHELAEFSTRSVYDMMEAEQLLQELKPRRAVYTHMSHDVDLRITYPLPPEVSLAYTGYEVKLGL